MNQWAFVTAAYAVTMVATVGAAGLGVRGDAPGRSRCRAASHARMIAKPKHQRLVLVVIAAIAVVAAVLLAMWGLRDRAAYFFTPATSPRARRRSASRRGLAEW